MIVKKQIGKLPTYIEDYVSDKSYDKKNRVTLYGSEFESKIDGNTYAPATLDSEAKTVTFDTEHWSVISNGTSAFLAGEKLDQFSFEENPEFVSADTDSEGKLLESTDVKGKKTIYGDLEVKGELKNNALSQQVEKQVKPAIEGKVDKEDGKSLIDEQIAKNLTIEDNPEFIDVKTDTDGKVISYRDNDGLLHENVGIKTKTLSADTINYSKSNLSDLDTALKEGGYGVATDWSDYISNDGDNPLNLPEPRCAIINLITADNIDLTQLNKAANLAKKYEGTRYNVPVEVQYWDKYGNYFRKKAYISGQGNSSMGFIKKNIAIDFFDSEYGGDAFATRFGKWVAQDSYHYKAHYIDFIRGVSNVSYKYADIVENYGREAYNDKPWKRALISDDDIIIGTSKKGNITEFDEQMETGALCHPDGFPAIIYQNGKFYGIFAQCLKKHRDNYHMSKSNPLHIHLDGWIGDSTLTGGTINWSQFEIRNPKNLYYKEAQTDKDGNQTYEYDADIAQAEIAGDDEVNAWITTGLLPDGTKITSKIKKNLQNTAKVKNSIIALSKYNSEIDSASTDDEKKALIEKYFDTEWLEKYLIIQWVVQDRDSMGKNWQWITYDGVKWYVCEYDKDNTIGCWYHGMQTAELWNISNGFVNTGGEKSILNRFQTLYKDDINALAKELIDGGIIDAKVLTGILLDWVDRIGFNNYEKEYAKWDECPCNRDDGVDNSNWIRSGYAKADTIKSGTAYSKGYIGSVNNNKVYKSLVANNTADVTDTASWEDVSFDSSKTYAVDDTCYVALGYNNWFQCFKAVAENSSSPITKTYTYYPKALGYRDTLWRYIKFINASVKQIKDYINKYVTQ